MSSRVAVIRFPGSNCEDETLRAIRRAGGQALEIWHRAADLQDADAVILPGGFSYGDYLRAGAIARFSPVMTAVVRHAEEGRPVLGICNGFQILCEVGLLPGALIRNAGQRFVSRPVDLRIQRTETAWTSAYRPGQVIRIPVGHGEGLYQAPAEVLDQLERDRRVVLRYVNAGLLDSAANPNGAVRDIAAICDASGLVMGMMPHPERLADPALGSDVGLGFFRSILSTLAAGPAPGRPVVAASH